MSKRQLLMLIFLLVAFGFALYFFDQAVGLASPWFGLLAMFCVLGVAAFSQPLFVFRVPPSLRALRAWESSARFHRALRVPAFGQFLTHTPLRLLNRSVYLKRQSGDIADVCAQVEAAEAAHFWAGLVLLPYIGLALLTRSWGAALALLLVEIVGSLYPILHLRLVRARIGRIMSRRTQ